MSPAATALAVRWHDAECGRYTADLAAWRSLVGGAPSDVLDLGAGSGRVSLALARDGHAVTAVELDPTLLAALAERAGDLPVEPVLGDIRALELGGRRWPLVIVPMQTVQLLGGVAGRRAMFAGIAAHLAPGGRVAVAIVTRFECFGAADGSPVPDSLRADGAVYVSKPLSVRARRGRIVVERERRVFTPGGPLQPAERDVIELDLVDVAALTAEAAPFGLALERVIEIPETDEHVANEVVVLGG